MIPLTEVRSDWLFHSTSYANIESIAKSQKLLPHDRGNHQFVSLSEKPMFTFGCLTLVFRRRSVAPRLLRVSYTKKWAKEHLAHTSYITDGMDYVAALEELLDIEDYVTELERDIARTRAGLARAEQGLKQAKAAFARYRSEENEDELFAAQDNVDLYRNDVRFMENERQNADEHNQAEVENLYYNAGWSLGQMKYEQEWVTKDEGKPFPFSAGELVAVLVCEGDKAPMRRARAAFSKLLPPKYIVWHSTHGQHGGHPAQRGHGVGAARHQRRGVSPRVAASTGEARRLQ
jgi:hypothetical protein